MSGATPVEQRRIIKKLVLTAIKAPSRGAGFASFREGFPTGERARKTTNGELGVLLDTFATRHSQLVDSLCSDQGIRLMNIDSQSAGYVQGWFTRRGNPALSIHDSFTIDYTRVRTLKWVMRLASRSVVGRVLGGEASGPGLDEMSDEGEVMLDFQWWRETARCGGILPSLRGVGGEEKGGWRRAGMQVKPAPLTYR